MVNGAPRKPLPAPRFRLVTLGNAELVRLQPGTSVETVLGPGKPVALLAYLAHVPGRSATRDQLVDLLWPDLAPEAARHALRQTAWFIRRRIGVEQLERTVDGIRISDGVGSDRDDFIEAVEQLRFDRAIDIYRGDFLERLATGAGPEFEHWLDLERYRLRLLLRRTAEVASQKHLAAGRFHEANRIARRFKRYAPGDYVAGRLAIQVSIAVGDFTAARAEADALEGIAENKSEPLDRESALVVARARSADSATGRTGVPRSDDTVGRDHEFAAATATWSEALEGSARHLHYVGPPGMGKTRLLDDVQRFLVASGATVVRVRSYEHAHCVPYSLASDLVAQVCALPGALGISPTAAASLLRLCPPLRDRFTVQGAAATEPTPPRDWIVAGAELFEAVSDEGPLAILVDEVHHADADSRLLLKGTLERLIDHPIMLVTTGRPTLTPFRLELSTPTASVPLTRLGEDDARRIIQRHVHDATADREGRWYDSSGGRPGPLLRLVRGGAVSDENSMDRAPIAPLSAEERRNLLACLLNDGRLSLPVADHLTGGRAVEAFEPLVQLGLIECEEGELTIGDRRVADLALSTTDVHARAAVHRRLGEAWLAGGRFDRAALTRAGWHFSRAGARDLLVEAYRRWVTLSRRLQPRDRSSLRPEAFLHTAHRDNLTSYLAAKVPAAARVRRRGAPRRILVGAASLVVGLATGYAVGLHYAQDRSSEIDSGVTKGATLPSPIPVLPDPLPPNPIPDPTQLPSSSLRYSGSGTEPADAIS